ncbi:DUF4825 domain-containing protein [Gracilibacillus alcaliphilus]|uniref:DUF4825 domain-containing protein n=1 Tax=Gracilibacillus alcaliphilus TaxID=1401441 RepID=UPI0019596D95|nr:DUF4825 domain-containing protein [Gracilibacillus alcaliphilus]MBM7677760.1 hypothetical protein [Gracilibacillus alcaliphilus]
MKKLLFIIGVAILLLSSCQATESKADIFKQQGMYLGDNSEVVSIINKLPNAEYFDSMELQTKAEPYGITLYYQPLASIAAEQEMAVHHATFLFALINNAETATFTFGGQSYTLTKTDLEKLYHVKLGDLRKMEETQSLIETHQQEVITNLLS